MISNFIEYNKLKIEYSLILNLYVNKNLTASVFIDLTAVNNAVLLT